MIGVPHDRLRRRRSRPWPSAPSPRGRPRTAEELIGAHGRERLAHYKCPKSVDIIEALPRNPTGKILKRDLRKPYSTRMAPEGSQTIRSCINVRSK